MARQALEAFLAGPGEFAIETAEGSRIDFLARRNHSTLTLDCWFFDLDTQEDVDAAVVRSADAAALLDCIFKTSCDAPIAERIRELAVRAGSSAPSPL